MEKYFDISELKFEDKEYFAPSGYDHILRTMFGNYMEMPPVENRITHDFKAWRIK